MLTATSRFDTPNASKYLQSLCKHFAHKVEVEYDAQQGQAALPPGLARFRACDTALEIEVTAEDLKGLNQARYIVEDHLLRFAFREDPDFLQWARTADTA